MHLVACIIALGGDTGQLLHRGPHDPVSWPEVGVLQMIHGEDAVTDFTVVSEDDDATRQSEKLRLVSIYGAGIVEQVYPGRNPMMEMTMPGAKKAPKKERDAGAPTAPPPVPEAEEPAPKKASGKKVAPSAKSLITPLPDAPDSDDDDKNDED